MLGNYLTFGETSFPNPITPTMSSQTIENVVQSEAGTDLVVVIRESKKFWNFTFRLSSLKRDFLRDICEEESTTMTYMGTQYTVRVRNFTEKLVQGSEWVTTSEGLYECSVKVTEF